MRSCLSMIGLFVVIALIFGACSAVFFGDDDYEDDDINYDYVEDDYNGDGEKDAEDYRIQTEGDDE